MCDMMVALGRATRDGRVLIAKNSDRHPNERERAWQEEKQLVGEAMRQAAAGRRPTGGLLYRSYWRRQTRLLQRYFLAPVNLYAKMVENYHRHL